MNLGSPLCQHFKAAPDPPLSCRYAPLAVTVAEAVEYVDLKRAETDSAYRDGPLRWHTAIKRYLAPLEGDPAFESVIDFPLTNGFSIADLSIAYVGLMLLDSQYPTLERMKSGNKPRSTQTRPNQPLKALGRNVWL
ncbi:MAG: hypothetical protein AB9869_36070 [Verrucomicrobiia bacterium]